ARGPTVPRSHPRYMRPLGRLLSRDRGAPAALGSNTPRIMLMTGVVRHAERVGSMIKAYPAQSPRKKVTGRRGKECVASLRAEQRLAAGGPQGSPDPG